jgi:trk system potassium uptake protein TrkA
MSEFVVFGLGRFGLNVALSLTRGGYPVLGVDSDEDIVRRTSAEIDTVVCADATNEETLRELGLERVSCAVVAIGAESTEASILTTALLKQIGVPRIVARAVTDLHARVLHTIGAQQVINPEAEMGLRLARQLAQPNVLDRFDLSEHAQVAEVALPEAFAGKSLAELELRRRYGISVIAVRRKGVVRATIDVAEPFESGDAIVIVGAPAAVRRIASVT